MLALWMVVALASLLGWGSSAFGQVPDPPEPDLPPLEADPPEPPAAKPATDASTPDFQKALELQRAKKWAAAQKAFRTLLEKFPQSVHKRAILDHSDDNAYAGVLELHRGGPSERRIDVCVMGDGFTIDPGDQDKEEAWGHLCLEVLYNEHAYREYSDYFNFWLVRLISLDEGVDPNLSPEERKKIEERNKSKTKQRKTDFSTALDCKAAGPQGQVVSDARLVRKWQRIADKDAPGCNDDGLTIAFARFGVLGMGGGGIANVGRPDKSVTVHEFGHAFVGLLDEYTNNPGRPTEPIKAPNASPTGDPLLVPWAHFLKKKIPNVGVFEGGATYIKGVWRPSRNCAMNSAGHTGYCPVCREAAILRVYSYVSPLDGSAPVTGTEVSVKEGAEQTLSVVPMRPEKHELKVTWYVEPIGDQEQMPVAPERSTGEPIDRFERIRRGLFGGYNGGKRALADRGAFDRSPAGAVSTLGFARKGDGKKPPTVEFPVGRLPIGRYRVTVAVSDPTPYVLLDSHHLLEERETWYVRVAPR